MPGAGRRAAPLQVPPVKRKAETAGHEEAHPEAAVGFGQHADERLMEDVGDGHCGDAAECGQRQTLGDEFGGIDPATAGAE